MTASRILLPASTHSKLNTIMSSTHDTQYLMLCPDGRLSVLEKRIDPSIHLLPEGWRQFGIYAHTDLSTVVQWIKEWCPSEYGWVYSRDPRIAQIMEVQQPEGAPNTIVIEEKVFGNLVPCSYDYNRSGQVSFMGDVTIRDAEQIADLERCYAMAIVQTTLIGKFTHVLMATNLGTLETIYYAAVCLVGELTYNANDKNWIQQ